MAIDQNDQTTSHAFCLQCIDGGQKTISQNISCRLCVDRVDTFSTAGMVKEIVDKVPEVIKLCKKNIRISVQKHHPKVIVIVAHDQCAGNPVSKDEQIKHLRQAKKIVASWPEAKGLTILLLFIEKDFKTVREIK